MSIGSINSIPSQNMRVRKNSSEVGRSSSPQEASTPQPSDQVELNPVGPSPTKVSPAQQRDTLLLATKVGLSMLPGLGTAAAALVPQSEVQDGVWTPSKSNQEVALLQVQDASLREVKNEDNVVVSHFIDYMKTSPGQSGQDIYLELPEGQMNVALPPAKRFGQTLEEAVSKFESSGKAEKAHLSLDVEVDPASVEGKTIAFLDKNALNGNTWTGKSAPAPTIDGAFIGNEAKPGLTRIKAQFEVPGGEQTVPALHRFGDVVSKVTRVQRQAIQTVNSEAFQAALGKSWVKDGLNQLGLSPEQAKASFYQYNVLLGTNTLTPEALLSPEGLKISTPATLLMAGMALDEAEKMESPELLKRLESEVQKDAHERNLGAIAKDYDKSDQEIDRLATVTEIKVNGMPKIDFDDPMAKNFAKGLTNVVRASQKGKVDPMSFISDLFGGLGDDMKLTKTETGMTLVTSEGKTVKFSQTDKALVIQMPDGERKEIPLPE